MRTVLTQQFFLLRTTIRDPRTRSHYLRAVGYLEQMLGRTARVDDLTDDHVAAMLHWLTVDRGQSPVTANGSHKCLCAFWRWCWSRGLIRTGPTVRPLQTPRRTPKAWRREELERLVAAARNATGSIGGMPASHWWVTLLAIEWDTGMRASELLSLRWEWLDLTTGWLTVPAEVRKGRHSDAVYGLLPDTLAWLRRFARPTGLILGFARHRSRYWQLWDDLLERAGLPASRYNKTQALRRSFGSWLEVGGGSATDALGHSSRGVTVKSYLDPTLEQRRHGERLPFRLLEKS